MNLIFDIGANVGEYLQEMMRRNPGCKFVAVEPQVTLFNKLISDFDSSVVTAYNKAVSSSEGTATLFHCKEDTSISSIDSDFLSKSCFAASEKIINGKAFKDHYNFGDPIEVETITIDSLIETHGVPDLLKVDIEGHEYEAFLGLTQKIPLVTFEWHEPLRDKIVKSVEYLSSIGFTLFSTEIWYVSKEYHDEEITDYKPIDDFVSLFNEYLDRDVPDINDREWTQRSGMVWAK
tara:strand:- start:338 stop:1039 length:702 start_codon:yes stop_codon:yes gene_type:complete